MVKKKIDRKRKINLWVKERDRERERRSKIFKDKRYQNIQKEREIERLWVIEKSVLGLKREWERKQLKHKCKKEKKRKDHSLGKKIERSVKVEFKDIKI